MHPIFRPSLNAPPLFRVSSLVSFLAGKWLGWLGSNVYGGFVPLDGYTSKGAERYLQDLWRDAPWYVATLHTLLAVLVMGLPPFLMGKICLFSQLSMENRIAMQKKMIHSRFYFVRMIAYAVRGHALVATLRDVEVRARLYNRT